MKRWVINTGTQEEFPKIDEMLEKVVELCKSYGYSLSHEDEHGGFIVVNYDPLYEAWLKDAMVAKVVK